MANGKSYDDPIFLAQGGDPLVVGQAFSDFVAAAKKSLHIAIYDFQLTGDSQALVVKALKDAAKRGVDVKIAYDHTKADTKKAKGGFTDTTPMKDTQGDPAKRGTQGFVTNNFPTTSKIQLMPIAGSHLMHNKYIIRDGASETASIWMGSANFTDGAWGLQENNIIRIQSKELASHYEQDFDDLWKSGNILKTGLNDYASVQVDGKQVQVAFAPGEGSAAASLFVDAIQGAGKTIYISTMVLSSGPILGALNDYIEQGGKLIGIYDATQMKQIESAWKRVGSKKLAQWKVIKESLVGKTSTPYSETAPHDYMHNKTLVTDNVVITGSFNLSENAESNAENVLTLPFDDLVVAYKAYVKKIVRKYTT